MTTEVETALAAAREEFEQGTLLSAALLRWARGTSAAEAAAMLAAVRRRLDEISAGKAPGEGEIRACARVVEAFERREGAQDDYAAGRRWFAGLTPGEAWDLGDQLVWGTFEWSHWFTQPPSKEFLRGMVAASNEFASDAD